jgi:uncharacterized protein YqjF (DUF2071 family)
MTDVTDHERLRMRERPPGRRVMRQIWRHLGFLHWRVDPADVAALLPPGLEVDTFDGAAYVGIVPFTIPLTRAGLLGVPMARAFHEINLRTYVQRGGRGPGVWFWSLDATSRLAVIGARIGYGLPYFAADIAMAVGEGGAGDSVDYRCRRRGSKQDLDPIPSPREAGRGLGRGVRPAAFSARYRPVGPVAPAAPGSLEFFLAERYLLYAHSRGGLRTARVHHAPYPLQPAAADAVEQTLTSVAGLPARACQGPPPLVHYAREVDVDIFGPRLDNPPRVR